LQCHFGLTESQLQVLEQAATAIAQERRQRQALQALNATLRQLEHDKNQFIEMLVHDLKNPLAAQIGCLELMQRESLTDYQTLLLENALRSSKQLSDLIANLLDIARLETGCVELERSLVPPHDLLNTCADTLRGWAIEEHKTLQVDATADLPLLYVDLRVMRRVLLNLLSNAIKHTPAGTHITLRAYPASAQTETRARGRRSADGQLSQVAIVEVADTGMGIPAEDLDRIFEKYARAAGQPQSRYDSTGIGLTFCRLAVEAHGGTIDVVSQIGVGTTFRLELPAR